MRFRKDQKPDLFALNRVSGWLGIMVCLLFAFSLVEPVPAAGQESGPSFEEWWVKAFETPSVPWNAESVLVRKDGAMLPGFEIIPAATGTQLVRVSIPFPAGVFPENAEVLVTASGFRVVPDLRVLTCHPGIPRSVRRAIVTFPYTFPDYSPVQFHLSLLPPRDQDSVVSATAVVVVSDSGVIFNVGKTHITLTPDRLISEKEEGDQWEAELLAPERKSDLPVKAEIIESGRYFAWARLLLPDERWPRILEVRVDCLGTVMVRAHLQRIAAKDGYTPDFGWVLKGKGSLSVGPFEKRFAEGETVSITFGSGTFAFPSAPKLLRGSVRVEEATEGFRVVYHRCFGEEKVPHQPMAWRRAGFVAAGPGQAVPTELFEPPHKVSVSAEDFDSLYESGLPLELSSYPDLEDCIRFHHEAIIHSALRGDDFGNVTVYLRGNPASVFGMNRLNHCPAIYREYYRSGDDRLRTTALNWCDNFYDLSIWWGREKGFGGTRYNNSVANNNPEHVDDKSFMWRSNNAVHFCTKGFDSFFYAYEETGDPRFLVALRSQIEYAKQSIHVNQGECRNIGDVVDFLRLAQFTGVKEYEHEALRLFRELREKVGSNHLFSQSGKPIVPNPPFIDDDQAGYEYPFAKPYILGYALEGLPDLGIRRPKEPDLIDVVRAVADFQASHQDVLGGWRYPHPASTRLLVAQGMEHSAQLCNAIRCLEAQGEPVDRYLDAVERNLKARYLVWKKTGKVLALVYGWERSAGILSDATTIYDLYAHPKDRDPSRDYSEGELILGRSSPEGLVYFTEVLSAYLSHRPVERLFHPGPELKTVLDRLPKDRKPLTPPPPPPVPGVRFSIQQELPVFREKRLVELDFPSAFSPTRGVPFGQWRERAREILLKSYSTPPPRADFQPVTLAVEDRGTYEVRKLEFNISGYERIPAYYLVPKGSGPFPGIVLLHDHGAHFSIGKEKVVRPFDEPEDRIRDAEDWANQLYGGRFIGDELAKRGYACLAIDALFWGDRGRKEGPKFEAQQAFAGNLFQLGLSWAGVIAWDDLRSVEFLRSQPEVDPERIGAVGLSMGANRCWHLAAGTDRVKVGAAICWMGTTPGLVAPGNNQTRGQSAYSMLHPGLRCFLDYPDVASIACPKPMLFYNGSKDGLFPVESVEAAYSKMREIWKSQGVSDHLVTKIWPVPHLFNVEMQEEAFSFLDRYLKK